MAIKDITPGTPTGQDLVLNGDDQIRQLKTDVLDTFPEMAGPPYEDADSNGAGCTLPVTNTTMSSWEARIAALEAVSSGPTGTSIPVGGIIVWYGTLASIPLGFKQCNGVTYNYTDGNQQTQQITVPDLRGRFIVGPDGAGGPVQGATGGVDWTTGQVGILTLLGGVHSHTTSTPGKSLEEGHLPEHSHAMFAPVAGVTQVGLLETCARSSDDFNYNIKSAGFDTATEGLTNSIGNDPATPHTHPSTTSSEDQGHAHLADVTPPFGAFYYICYVADGTPA